MSQIDKFLQKILSGQSDNNINFNELRFLLLKLNFKERIKGDHHIFTKEDIDEILNIQPNGNNSKAYQIKQIRNIILKYKLGGLKYE